MLRQVEVWHLLRNCWLPVWHQKFEIHKNVHFAISRIGASTDFMSHHKRFDLMQNFHRFLVVNSDILYVEYLKSYCIFSEKNEILRD